MEKKVVDKKVPLNVKYEIADTRVKNGLVYLKVTEHNKNTLKHKWIIYQRAINDSKDLP